MGFRVLLWQRPPSNDKLVPQMDNRFDRPDATQCVECGRFRTAGTWHFRAPLAGEVVSHTICPECQPSMLDELRWEMEFPAWSQEKQLEAVRLRVRHIPMDIPAVETKLRNVHDLPPRKHEDFFDEIRPYLVDRLCPYCKLPIENGQPTMDRAGYTLHRTCAAHLSDSMLMITTLAPAEQHLDAYMDVARIPHGVRDGVRRDIEQGAPIR